MTSPIDDICIEADIREAYPELNDEQVARAVQAVARCPTMSKAEIRQLARQMAGLATSVAALASGRRACAHCTVLFPEDLLFDGYCVSCAGEHLALPDADRDFLEGHAVAACVEAGLRAEPRPCPEPQYHEHVGLHGQRVAIAEKCTACRSAARGDLDGPIRRADRYVRPRHDAAFTERDGADLEAYFRCPAPSPVWDRSNFGAMCERLAAQSRPHSTDKTKLAYALRTEWRRCVERTEARCSVTRPVGQTGTVATCGRPTIEHVQHFASQHRPAHRGERAARGFAFRDIEVNGRIVQVQTMSATSAPNAQSCEIMAAKGSHSEPSYDEVDVWSFVDGRAAMRDTGRALELVPKWALDTLEARYSRSQDRGITKQGRVMMGMSREQAALRDKLGLLDEVAALTSVARELASQNAEGPTQYIAQLAALTVDATKPRAEKQVAAARLDRVRVAARALLTAAQAVYAEASLEVRNGTRKAPEAAAQ